MRTGWVRLWLSILGVGSWTVGIGSAGRMGSFGFVFVVVGVCGRGLRLGRLVLGVGGLCTWGIRGARIVDELEVCVWVRRGFWTVRSAKGLEVFW